MSNEPSHIAYVVSDPKEGSDGKAQGHQVAAIWPHKAGNGFDLVIPPGVTLSGRIVCRPPKKRESRTPRNPWPRRRSRRGFFSAQEI